MKRLQLGYQHFINPLDLSDVSITSQQKLTESWMWGICRYEKFWLRAGLTEMCCHDKCG